MHEQALLLRSAAPTRSGFTARERVLLIQGATVEWLANRLGISTDDAA
jgi:hypothetical protein